MKKTRLNVLLLMLAYSHLTSAETISGHVTDDGVAMEKVDVMLYETGGDILVETGYSDNSGMYRFAVSAGKYKICVSADEYAYKCVGDVAVSGKDIVVDITMTPTAFVEKQDDTSSDDCD